MLSVADYEAAVKQADSGIGRSRVLKQLLLAAKSDRYSGTKCSTYGYNLAVQWY